MSASAWSTVAERGSVWGMRVTAWIYRRVGYHVATALVIVVVTYFFLTDRRGRAASLRYLGRVYAHPDGARMLGRQPTLRHCFRHYVQFGLAGIDRLRVAMGSATDIDFIVHGEEALAHLVQRGEGAVLVGAHLGSFDALRVLAERAQVPVNIVMSTRHAARLTSVLRRAESAATIRVFDVDFAAPQTVFALRACVARGEFVAILADRVGPGAHARPVRVPFLGADAPFPRGPFVLAAVLQCTIILLIGVRRGPRCYEIFVERLRDPADGTPAGRRAWVRATIADYARGLESHCLRAPYQWFNFFDFWDEHVPSGQAAT